MQKEFLSKQFRQLNQRITHVKTKINKLDKHKLISVIVLSFLLTLILEVLSRRSIGKGFAFLVSNPLMFLFNNSIILLTLSVTRIFPRRDFFTAVVSLIWLGLAITNFIMQSYRSTPFTAMDFYLLKSAVKLLPLYLKTFQMILLAALAAAIITAMVFLWKKVKKGKYSIKYPLIMACVSAFLMLATSAIAVRCGLLSKEYGNLPDAFSDYGFAFCFSNSIVDQGISRPNHYSKKRIDEILQEIESNKPKTKEIQSFRLMDSDSSETKPNIIMIQLESFFDVNLLKNYSFSENPIPNFTRLKKEYTSGYLTVPVFGAGTVNTEFEVISGMNTKYFGTGEYPYRTILKSTTCESICYDLEELGYHSYAIHNNTALFYDRNNVLPRLGFDNFDSIEYMNPVEFNHIGWAKDKVLKDEIFDALEADSSRDFIYTITVQSHGKYPDEAEDSNQRIQALQNPTKSEGGNSDKNSLQNAKSEIDESQQNQLEYYVNQLNNTDQMIGALTDALSDYNEPVVVAFFGDHLPPLSIEDEDLLDNNKFQTEYVLWSNYPMEKKDQDLAAYQLNSYLMECIGYENGVLNKFHQRCNNTSDYEENLKLLQYDMLYGKHYVYDGENPFTEKSLKMGINDITVEDVYKENEDLIIKGKNFTPWSIVYFGDKPKETVFIDDSTLKVPEGKSNQQSIYVKQVTDNNMVLSKSNEWKQ